MEEMKLKYEIGRKNEGVFFPTCVAWHETERCWSCLELFLVGCEPRDPLLCGEENRYQLNLNILIFNYF